MFFFPKLSKKTAPDWSFQLEAITAVLRDFHETPTARILLVIPTGGGKTLTALRSLSEMLNRGQLSKKDKVLWVVHTLSLHAHAIDNLNNEDNYKKFALNPILKDVVDVRMKEVAAKDIGHNSAYKIVVIDEAHHSAADTYRDFFEYPVGILGLTATPHRMDQKELPFKKISYSITFRELVRRHVVLLPKFLPEVRTHLQIDVSSLQDDSQLERFNNRERNNLIADHIFRETEKHLLKKIVVFAGTNAHVERLYEVIKKKNENYKTPLFEHVGYIFGGDNNDHGISNKDYLRWHRHIRSSVLVNCKILNEGYDDPNLDTIVMATPTNSILYYLQCIGRVVRTPEDYKNAQAFVIEIVDQLPNVAYRIDNRWLFAEISDFLEPCIVDIKIKWPFRTASIFFKLVSLHVQLSDLTWKDWSALLIGKKINFLLFNDVPDRHSGKWRIVSIKDHDIEMIRAFNDISKNIEDYYLINHDYIFERKYPSIKNRHPFNSRVFRSSFFAALHRALLLKKQKMKVDSIIYLSVQ